MKSILIFIFAISISSANAQLVGAYDDGSRRYNQPNEIFSISASPLALLDIYSGAAYKAGVSICPVYFLRLTADAGGYIPGMSRSISAWNDMKGYHFRGSLGISPDKTNEWSFGLEYQYKKQSFNYADSIPNEPKFNAEVNKFVHVGNVYLAIKPELAPRLYLEVRVGLGVRYRDISNTGSDHLSNSHYWRDSWSQGSITNKQSFMPNFSLSVRLNYTLWEHWI